MVYLFGDPSLAATALTAAQAVPEALQGSQWHCTLAVAYFQDAVPGRGFALARAFAAWRLVQRAEQELRIRIRALTVALRLPARVTFDFPPFHSSWTLGLQDNGDLETFQTLQAVAEHILSTMTDIGAVRLRRRRPIHVSWL